MSGVDAVTGRYLRHAASEAEERWAIRNERRDENRERTLELASQDFGRRKDPDRRPAPGVDPKDLRTAGWGVVFPEDVSLDVRDALAPLLNYRKKQVGREDYFRDLTYLPGESKNAFLARLEVKDGAAHPDQLPYYLLLVGGEEQIPHRFQYLLDLQYAVGRLDFEHPKDYRAYAENVKACERGSSDVLPEAVLFGASHKDDRATGLSWEHLVMPLETELRAKHTDWRLRRPDRGSKEELARILGGGRTPALLFTATHGMVYPSGHPEQEDLQGSLLCQDWEGPGPEPEPIPESAFFSARDIPDAARLQGLMAFLFGCYTAGTPELDDFPPLPMRNRIRRAPRHFTSALVRRLLAHPRGGALAVVGHVDRAWTHSFHPGRGEAVGAISYVLQHLLAGYPIGCAMDFLNERFAELSTELTDALDRQKVPLERGRPDRERSPRELLAAWRSYKDARNFVLFGDPAVRLAVAPSGASVGGAPLPVARSAGVSPGDLRLQAALDGLRERSPVPLPGAEGENDEEDGLW